MIASYISAGRTDIGRVRRHNEDAILVTDTFGLWAVADGLGGHSAGDLASTLIVDSLRALHLPSDIGDLVDTIEDQLVLVNHQLRCTARERRVNTIASTVVLLLHTRDLLVCGWVGDSRAYCFEEGQLRQLTRDHVHGDRGDLTQFGDPAASAQAGVLNRAVGAEDQLFVEWQVCARRAGMTFVLCSDGINKELSDADIEAACRRHTEPSALVESMVNEALARAGRDNVSAVVVRINEMREASV